MTIAFFGGYSPSRMAQFLAIVRESHRHIEERVYREWNRQKPGGRLDLEKRAIASAIKQLEKIVARADAALAQLAAQRGIKKRAYRRFMIDHGVMRDARKPNIWTAVLVAQAAILVEGLGTAILMISDGKADVLEGAATGITVAGVNFAAGLFAGFFAARRLNYRIRSPFPEPRDRAVRGLAYAAFATITGFMVALNFGAMRVRATGEHADIWNWDTVSFGATFSDYPALVIAVLGAIGGCVAIYEGFGGLSDPIPGFTRARREAEEDINDAAEGIADRYLDAADTVFETNKDRIEDLVDALEEDEGSRTETFATLNDAINAHNHQVDAAIEEYRRLSDEDRVRIEFIMQKRERGRKLDVSAFEALRHSPLIVPEADSQAASGAAAAEQMQRLDAAYELTCAAIEEAHTAFLADVSAFDLDENSGD